MKSLSVLLLYFPTSNNQAVLLPLLALLLLYTLSTYLTRMKNLSNITKDHLKTTTVEASITAESTDTEPTSNCESVNYHITRICNYKCKFCFHTAKSSFVRPLEEAKLGLAKLKEAGMKKINFSGGEPFTVKHLGELVAYCKTELQLESVTIVSNGSLIKEVWFQKYGKFLDIIAISCDSFVESTLVSIGRGVSGSIHLHKL